MSYIVTSNLCEVSVIHTSTMRRGRYLLWGMLAFLFCMLLRNPSVALAGVRTGLALCASTLIPALFPFFVLTNLFVKSGLAARLGRLVALPCRLLFGLGKDCGAAVILGAVSGYPVGATCTVSLYENGLCSREEAARMLAFCNNAGPAFLIGGVGATLWRDVRVGILLYVAQMVAAVVVGVAFRLPTGHARKREKRPATSANFREVTTPTFRMSDLVHAVPAAVTTMLQVCGFVLFFEVILSVLFSVADVFSAFPLVRTLIAALLEVSSGATTAASAFGWQTPVMGITLTGIAVGWSGLSVALQVSAITEGTDIPLSYYLRGKILQGLLTGGFALAGAVWLFS